MADDVVDPLPLLQDPFDTLSLPSDLPDFDLGDFSIDDFLDFPDPQPAPCSEGSNTSAPHTPEPSVGPDPPQSDTLNSDSPKSGVFAAGSPDSRNSATAHGEEKRRDRGLKRKKGREEADSSCLLSGGCDEEEDDKRRLRLMRNRESAQLSRQRKKQYVEELEEKVKSMHSTISDLNNRIAYIVAENANLRQQLAGGGAAAPPGGVYVPFPWVPYPVRMAASHVPLVPIPKLKPQVPPPVAMKGKKPEAKKVEGRTKKVAGVSLLGLLFCALIVGTILSGVGFDLFGNRRNDGEEDRIASGSHGRVLTVSGDIDRMVGNVDRGSFSNGHEKRLGGETDGGKMGGQSDAIPCSGNASEPLFASLYVPRNDKLVKIDGNLIISSVLAGESAKDQLSSGVETSHTRQGSREVGKETDVAIRSGVSSALAVVNSGRHSHMYRAMSEHQKALPSGSRDMYADNWNSASSERLPQDWFREGLEGPIFSSGACTEVFQFDASQQAGIVPATSVANTTKNITEEPPCTVGKLRNRRILYSHPIQLGGSTSNDTEELLGAPHSDADDVNAKSKSMVVSVVVDPREAGDGDCDGRIMPKSISRIFVVVLVDSVKYITYSCVLPFKANTPHLVAR